MHSHPLVEIRFWRQYPEGLLQKTVHWYHVPRIGDEVVIGSFVVGEDGDSFEGDVKRIIWREIRGIVDIQLG